MRGPIALSGAVVVSVGASALLVNASPPVQWVLVGLSALAALVATGAQGLQRLPVFSLLALAPFAVYGPGVLTLGAIVVALLLVQSLGLRNQTCFRLAGGLLAFAALVSLITSGSDVLAYGSLLTAVGAYIAFNRLFAAEAHQKTARAGVAVLMLWTAAVALLQIGGINPVEALNLDPLLYAPEGRVSGAFVHPISMGLAGAFGICLLAGQRGWLARLGLGAAAACVGLAQTRIVFLALAVALGFTLLRGRSRRLKVLAGVAVFIPLGVWGLQNVEAGRTSIYDSLAGRFKTESVTGSTQSRWDLWGATFEMVKDHPFGVGAGQYPEEISAYNPGALGVYEIRGQRQVTGGAENLYMHVLAEMGWLGLAALITLIATGGWRARSDPALLSFWIVVVVTSVTAYSVLGLPVALLFAMGAALTARARHHQYPRSGATEGG